MKTKLFFILLAIAWNMNASAQTIKTYSGGMEVPKDAYFAIGKNGDGSYQYYEKNGKRVKHGFFRFTNKYYSITGQFVDGCKQGTWNFQYKNQYKESEYNYAGSVNKQYSMTFKNDLPNGRYQYTYYEENDGKWSTYESSSATMKNGILSGKFTVSYSNNNKYNNNKWTANCTLDSHGRANGTWIVNRISERQKSVKKFEFCHGMHIRTSKYSESTGETEILYSDKDYNTYNRLSKIECDTLVKGVGHCLLNDDMLYRQEIYYPRYSDAYQYIMEKLAYIDFEHVFCTWSAYKTITQIAAEEQEARKMEEEKRILKEKQEEEARRIAEARRKRKEAISANATLLKQVADNDHKIDSIYRKKNKPFFYNISSEYVKPIIYNKYKFCRTMDSCDVASIKEVLHLQDVIMKLRYMKTKKVKKQLKVGYTGDDYTTENAEKFYKNFFINEALNLAQ